jgi:excinuclease ABC subunit A
LAFDTLFAEGQRRYVESLSPYARQFLGVMDKPDVDSIEGLSPAIAINQKAISHNPRSTVGTVTEIYDYLRLLFARIGHPHCPTCGREIAQMGSQQIIEEVEKLIEQGGSKYPRFLILAPLVRDRKGEFSYLFANLRRQGYTQVRLDGQIYNLAEDLFLIKTNKHTIEAVIDRITAEYKVQPACRQGRSSKFKARLTDSVEQALKLSNGLVIVAEVLDPSFEFPQKPKKMVDHLFSQKFACPVCNLSLPEIEPRSFSFNSPHGACPTCSGIGTLLSVDEGLASSLGLFPKELEWRYWHTDSEMIRQRIERFMKKEICPDCQGMRLKPEVLSITIDGKSIAQVASLSIRDLFEWVKKVGAIKTNSRESVVAEPILKEIASRLDFLLSVGLDYLTLDRPSLTLAGGEAQRIRLASQIGSGLSGVCYCLDEPTIGLHQRDNKRLIATLKRLRDLGNTVVVVEHDREMMESADWIVDFGPGAGERGGKIVAQGTPEQIKSNKNSLTGDYLAGRKKIEVRSGPPASELGNLLKIKGCSQFNLKNIDVSFPLGKFTCVTGISGSGKSTLVVETLYHALRQKIDPYYRQNPGKFKEILGVEKIDKVILIDQSPIGRTPRSNPVTYTGAFTFIRQLFAQSAEARVRGYQPGRFSFNVKGGRCENCEGGGKIKVEMQFLPDVYVTCEVCQGKRYNSQTLEVEYKDKNIAQVLDFSVEEAIDFFTYIPLLRRHLEILRAVGLGYIRLGQPAPTLSGGEAQRVKLAAELGKKATGRTVYILDEPTTGLHFADLEKLLLVLRELVKRGNTVIIIEHNLDVIKNADWIIDLGPEGGDQGGYLICQGTPVESSLKRESYTGQFLRKVL